MLVFTEVDSRFGLKPRPAPDYIPGGTEIDRFITLRSRMRLRGAGQLEAIFWAILAAFPR
jgi:hypothetical protein